MSILQESALNIGKDNLFKYYKNLRIGKKIPFELSLNRSQYINKKQKVSDQLIADSGYGQGQIFDESPTTCKYL